MYSKKWKHSKVKEICYQKNVFPDRQNEIQYHPIGVNRKTVYRYYFNAVILNLDPLTRKTDNLLSYELYLLHFYVYLPALGVG